MKFHATCQRELASMREDRDAWRALAQSLIARQFEWDERLMVKAGPAPSATPVDTTPHVMPDSPDEALAWERADELAEIEEKARMALIDPTYAYMVETSAEFDATWAPVRDRLRTLKQQANVQ